MTDGLWPPAACGCLMEQRPGAIDPLRPATTGSLMPSARSVSRRNSYSWAVPEGRCSVVDGLGLLADRRVPASLIDHNQLFFKDDGTSIRNLSYPAKRWRLSLERLGQRYRRPYCARHSSVSWNLMIGKNPLFVARQHGHSLVTMWRTYAAWMVGALESDIGLIRAAIENSAPELVPSSVERDSAAQVGLTLAERLSNTESGLPREGAPVAEFGTRFVTRCGTPSDSSP
jgi:hypothetical protein